MSMVDNNSRFEISIEDMKGNILSGNIVSVNILFYNSLTDEFLLCKEKRKPTPQSMYKEEQTHVFGGKVEKTDPSPLYTGIREFVEELQFYFENLTREKTINRIAELLSDNNVMRVKKDICVSPRNQLYNRFYIIDINTINNNLKTAIIQSVYNWRIQQFTEITSVFFWKRDSHLEKPSSLLNDIKNQLPSAQFLKG